MPETLKKMVERVRDILKEPIPARWTDEQIKGYLNRGQENLAILAERTKTVEITLPAGEGSIVRPDDFLMIKGLYWLDAPYKREIKPGMSNIPLDDTTVGDPRYFYMQNEKFEIRPIPVIDRTIYVVYYQRPPDMEMDEDLPFFKFSEDVLVSFAVFRAYAEDNDPRMQLWEEDYYKQSRRWLVTETQNYQEPFQQLPNW